MISVEQRFFNQAGHEQLGLRTVTELLVAVGGQYHVPSAGPGYTDIRCEDVGATSEELINEGHGDFEAGESSGVHLACYQPLGHRASRRPGHPGPTSRRCCRSLGPTSTPATSRQPSMPFPHGQSPGLCVFLRPRVDASTIGTVIRRTRGNGLRRTLASGENVRGHRRWLRGPQHARRSIFDRGIIMWTSTRPELDAVPCCEACKQVQDVLRGMEFQRVEVRAPTDRVARSVDPGRDGEGGDRDRQWRRHDEGDDDGGNCHSRAGNRKVQRPSVVTEHVEVGGEPAEDGTDGERRRQFRRGVGERRHQREAGERVGGRHHAPLPPGIPSIRHRPRKRAGIRHRRACELQKTDGHLLCARPRTR